MSTVALPHRVSAMVPVPTHAGHTRKQVFMESDRLSELREIIAQVLDVDEELIGYETHFVNDLGVDSLMALEVMVTLERKYKIKMTEEDLKRITCLRDVHELLLSRLESSTSGATA